jgi:prepilin-type N-terminal cleavage/methylation domain-containing protein
MKINLKSKVQPRRVARANAFTLIEMIMVIAIVGILAAFLVSGFGVVKPKTSRKRVETELQKLIGYLEAYKAKTGSYPPDNTNDPGRPPLFYELMGTYTTNNGGDYFTLDDRETINQTSVANHLYIGGFMNSAATASTGRGFLSSPKHSEYMVEPYWTNNSPPEFVWFLVAPIKGTDTVYAAFNPWRYVVSNPTNNPKTYDLWAEIVIGRQTNIIGNWK